MLPLIQHFPVRLLPLLLVYEAAPKRHFTKVIPYRMHLLQPRFRRYLLPPFKKRQPLFPGAALGAPLLLFLLRVIIHPVHPTPVPKLHPRSLQPLLKIPFALHFMLGAAARVLHEQIYRENKAVHRPLLVLLLAFLLQLRFIFQTVL